VPALIVDLLAALEAAGLSEHFTCAGTNALHAYEAAAGVRLDQHIMATLDMDLLSKFSEIVVSENARMSRMRTVDPRAFARFKIWMSKEPDREARKRERDALQAQAVLELVQERLPQLPLEGIEVFPAEMRNAAGQSLRRSGTES
jgi:hypothetical protein